MAKKQEQSSLFEIIVVLAIVFIVAFTGQVLIHFEKQGSSAKAAGANSLTGFVVSGDSSDSAKDEFLDVGISNIDVNPPSPIIGEPFDVKVQVKNEGFVATETPFYIKLEIIPNGETADATMLFAPMPKNLKPGEESAVSFTVTLFTKEGPLRIIATADATSKLNDHNSANNKRSATVIITN